MMFCGGLGIVDTYSWKFNISIVQKLSGRQTVYIGLYSEMLYSCWGREMLPDCRHAEGVEEMSLALM